jgi:hypothetical protein
LDQASKLSASRPVLSVGMLKFIELVSVLCGRVRFLKTDAVVHELLRLPHSGAPAFSPAIIAPLLRAAKRCDTPYSCAGL